jgi:hypothetical protein
VEVITAVENVVVRRRVSKIVDVVVVVSVVKDVVVSGSKSVVSCVCCWVKKRDWSSVTSNVRIAVAVMVIDLVLVLVMPFAVLVKVEVVVAVLMESVKNTG